MEVDLRGVASRFELLNPKEALEVRFGDRIVADTCRDQYNQRSDCSALVSSEKDGFYLVLHKGGGVLEYA